MGRRDGRRRFEGRSTSTQQGELERQHDFVVPSLLLVEPLGHDLVEQLGYARFMGSGGFETVFHFGRDASAIYLAFAHVVQCATYMMLCNRHE